MSITLYGIKNCDSVKKARRWLDEHAIEYRFHDFRTDGLERAQVDAWLEELGLALINKRSTSWKALDSETQSNLTQSNLTETNAAELVLNQPTLIKRPLLDTGNHRHLGFKADEYQQLLQHL